MKKSILKLSLFASLVLVLTGCPSEPEDHVTTNKDPTPIVIQNEDGTSFTVTPRDAEAKFSISEDKKIIYLDGKVIKDGDAVADGNGQETYTLTGNFKGQIVTVCKDVEIVLNNANIENENSPAILGMKCVISTADGTTNNIISKGIDSEFDKSAAIYITDGKLVFAGNGTLNIKGEICHGVKAGKIEIKDSGTYCIQGTADGSALNCNEFNAENEADQNTADFTVTLENSKNGIKADNTIKIERGTFNFKNLTTALKTDKASDDPVDSPKEHKITLSGGTFNYDSTVSKFTSTEKGKYTCEGATINQAGQD